jgi:signal transduction histidine kinase
VIYGEQEEYLKSLDYYKKAADTFEDLGMRQFVTSSYQNIGIVYKNLGKYKLSMNYYEKALNIAQDLGDRNMVATIYSNLSELHFALADSTHGSAGQKRDHYAAGLQSGEKAISIAKDIGALPLINSMARSLINMHKKAGNLEKALQYTDLYIETQDSLFNKEKARAIEELEASYQAEKKQLRIDKLEQEKALQQARMRSQRILIIVFIGGILVILVFSFIIYRQYKQKQNAYKMVVAQNEEIQIQKESITQYAQELSRLNATKNKFFSIIAHDLKNPFNSLLGNSVLLKEKLESATKDELREFVDEIHSASERGYNLLLNLLEWSRAQTGRLNIDPQNIYLNDVVQQSIFLLQPNAKEKNITIENKLSEPVFVYADYNSTTTILRNLLANAIKYSGEGDVVTIYSKQENGYVKVIVEDQGMGIPKDKQDKLFQIDSAYSTPGTSDEKGTGLGLLLCKEFAEKNHGNIDFTSEEGKGSIFYFTLKEGSDNL